MKITSGMLCEAGACAGQLATFEREWPDGAEVTRENLARAIALSLDIEWAAEHLLTAPAWKVYNEARVAAFLLAWDSGKGCKYTQKARAAK